MHYSAIQSNFLMLPYRHCVHFGNKRTAYTVRLQYVLLCFIYFSKVEIVEFLRSFCCLNIFKLIWIN